MTSCRRAGLDRRGFSIGMASVALGCVTPTRASHAFAPAQLLADVNAYAALGHHRSGAAVELQTLQWIQNRLSAFSYQLSTEAIAIEAPASPFVRIGNGDDAYVGFVQARAPESVWDAAIEAPLALTTSVNRLRGSIAVLEAPAPAGAYWPESRDGPVNALAQAGALALVLSVDANGDTFAFNRDLSAPTFPIPVVILNRANHRDLLARTANGSTTRLSFPSGPTPTHTFVVSGRKAGSGRWIVISTPLTGWFASGAERGPGVALFLALASALQERGAPVMLIGAGGHEIGHIGMDRALASVAPDPNDVKLWIHLGASIAARAERNAAVLHPTQAMYASPDLAALTQQVFANANPPLREANAQSPGETGQIVGRGFTRVVGFAGSHRDFHTPADDGALVDGDQLSAIGQRLLRLALDTSLR